MQPERVRKRNLFTGRPTTAFAAPARLGIVPALSLVLGLFAALSLTNGCSRGRGPVPARKPYQGLMLTVACPGEPAATLVRRYGQIWASRTGAQVQVVGYDPAVGPERGPAADLWVLASARMPHWAQGGKLCQVPDALRNSSAAYAWQNVLPLYRFKLCVWDQKVYALPLLGDAQLCFYREDLFREHRVPFKKKYGHELTAPATWDEFAQIAEYFHNQKRHGMDPPSPSLAPLPERAEDLDRLFYSVAVPFARRAVREDDPSPPPSVELFSFHYDLERGTVRIDTPGFVHALRLLKRLQAFRPPGTSADPATAFQKGEAVMCLASPAWISRFQEAGPVRDRFAMCRVPGSNHVVDYATGQERAVPDGNWVPYLGAESWLMAVPSRNPEPEAAFALAASLSDPRTSLDIVIEPAWAGGVFRSEHLEAGVGWHQLGLDSKRKEKLVDLLRETVLHPQVKNPVLRLRTPDEREHQEAVDAALRAALLDGKEADQALQEAAESWRQLDARQDVKTRLSEYRRSLGL